MKTQKLFLALLVCCIAFVSCKKEPEYTTRKYVTNFEDVMLADSLGYWNGLDRKGTKEDAVIWEEAAINYYSNFTSGFASFENKFTSALDNSWTSWMGFACSKLIDTNKSNFYANPAYQYNVIAGTGAGQSVQFAIAYADSAIINIPKNDEGYYSIKSIKMTNSTYAYYTMKDGDGYAKKFNSTDQDWFKVTIKGYRDNNDVGELEHYLADFRNGRSHISDSWETVDLSLLGKVDKLVFYFDSTDKNEYGLLNPAYVCIDDMVYEQKVEIIVD